jgi:hypothetical protein
MWIADMQPVYEARAARERIEFDPKEVFGTVTIETKLPPPVVWDYLADTEFRKILFGSDRQEVSDRKTGRIAAGTTYQCYHGKKVFPQVVLEWEPFDRMVIETSLRGDASLVLDYQLTAVNGGTVLATTAARLRSKGLGGVMLRAGMPIQALGAKRGMRRFRDRIEEDFERRQSSGPSPQIDLGSIAETAASAVAGWSALSGGDTPQ